jgi:hypothetical protein
VAVAVAVIALLPEEQEEKVVLEEVVVQIHTLQVVAEAVDLEG